MVFRNENLYRMDFEDTGNFGGDEFGYGGYGITSLPIQQPIAQPIPQPIYTPPVQQPVAQQPVAQPLFQPAIQQVINPEVQQPNIEQTAVEGSGVFGLPSLVEQKTQPTQPAQQLAQPTGPSQETLNALTQQILGSSDTSRWTGQGFGSAQANAADMANILAKAGLTDVRQLGVKQEVVPAQYFESGEIPEHTVNKYYNKETGQDLGNLGGTYAERQTGNFFGGTFEGKGNTGYGVQFRPDGTPVFYTQGASSNDLAKIMDMAGPVGNIALAVATGGLSIPQQIAANMAMQVLSGKDIGDAAKSAAISFAGSQIPGLGAVGEGASFIKDLGLSPELTKTLTNSFQNAVVSGGTALLSGKDVGPAMLAGAATGGVNGAVNALMGNIEGFGSLTDSQKKMAINAVTGVISGKPLDQIVINSAISAANEAIAAAKAPTVKQEPDDLDALLNQLAPYKQSETTLPNGIQLAANDSGTYSDAGTGYKMDIGGAPIFAESPNANAVRPPAGYELLSAKQADAKPSGSYYDATLNAWLQPTNEFVRTTDLEQFLADAGLFNAGKNTLDADTVQDIINKSLENVPTGLTEDDLAKSLGMTKKELLDQFNMTEDELQQRIDDLSSEFGGQLTGATEGLESKIAGTQGSVDALAKSLGTTKADLLAQLGTTEDELQSQISGLQTGLESKIGDVQTGLSGQISQQGEQFQTLLQQYRDLGMDENTALRQTIDDLGSTFGEQLTGVESGLSGQISKQGEQFQTLLQQYRDLGMDENEALRQTIDDLGSNVSGQFEDIGSQLSGLRGDVKTQIDETNTKITDIADALGTTKEELMDRLNVSDAELRDLIGGQVSGLRGDIKTQIDETNTKITNIADALGTTEEELMNRLNLSEEELRDLISGVGEETKTALAGQAADTKTQFQNLTTAQQAQAKALTDQGTSLTNAINQVQSTTNLNTLMMLMNDGQQPVQQTPMQDPYAHIKLMEELFGSDIDLTPAGEDTAKRK